MAIETKPDPDLLDIEELAVKLRASVYAARELTQRPDFPCRKVGREWRFYWPAVCRWFEGRDEPRRFGGSNPFDREVS